ncbi:hypothetical protein JM654_14480 [Microbacterium oxydans]|nr:hypothetical protein [Microbacterium oxydans]
MLHIGLGHDHASPGLTGCWEGAREWRDAFVEELAGAYRADSHPMPRPPDGAATTTGTRP